MSPAVALSIAGCIAVPAVITWFLFASAFRRTALGLTALLALAAAGFAFAANREGGWVGLGYAIYSMAAGFGTLGALAGMGIALVLARRR